MTYTEYVIDALFDQEENQAPWVRMAKERVEAVIEACLVKVKWPPPEVAIKWDSEAQSNFRSFRKDVQDVTQSAFVLLGVDIFQKLAMAALHSLTARDWLFLEATLFCLNALSDSVSENDSVDDVLSALFETLFSADVTSTEATIPARTRQTVVNTISRFTFFFERDHTRLPAMLNFLFESLKSPSLADAVAKAIYLACSLCRKSLTSELGAFLKQYELILSWESTKGYPKEKLVGAIASIVEALPTDEEKLGPLSILMKSVEADASGCIQLLNTLKQEDAQEKGLCTLRSLLCMGKALQAPDDVVVDLEVEQSQSTFWTEGQGASLQATIIQIVNAIASLMKWSSDIIETSSQILRVGFKESSPGLFVFHPKVTVDFLLAQGIDTARLDHVLDTAGILLIGKVDRSDDALKEAASLILSKIFELMSSMGGELH